MKRKAVLVRLNSLVHPTAEITLLQESNFSPAPLQQQCVTGGGPHEGPVSHNTPGIVTPGGGKAAENTFWQ